MPFGTIKRWMRPDDAIMAASDQRGVAGEQHCLLQALESGA